MVGLVGTAAPGSLLDIFGLSVRGLGEGCREILRKFVTG